MKYLAYFHLLERQRKGTMQEEFDMRWPASAILKTKTLMCNTSGQAAAILSTRVRTFGVKIPNENSTNKRQLGHPGAL